MNNWCRAVEGCGQSGCKLTFQSLSDTILHDPITKVIN